MKILSVLVLCCLANISCQELHSKEDNLDAENYQIEEYPSQVHLFNPKSLRTLRAIVKPGLFSLMGKRSSAKTQVTRRRQKFQSFVGLMGKRNLGEQSEYSLQSPFPCDQTV